MSIETGQTFGRYKVKRVLGQGGFATVCLAFDPALQRDVALKVAHAELAADPDLAARFQGEARQLARMRHPNIVAVHDVGEEHSRPYFTMDYLEGETLHDVLSRRHTLPLGECAEIAMQLAGALDYLHALGVVHRDLKPANLMIGAGGRLTLLDFGIARALDQTQLTRTGAVIGTPQYMAPEQVKGQPIGPPVDIYAMAVLLYRCLSGRVPFDGDALSVLHQQAWEAPPPLCSLRPDLPGAVCNAIDAGLAKDPAVRPRSAGQLASRLAEAAGVDSTIPPLPSEERTIPPPHAPPRPLIPPSRPSRRAAMLPYLLAGVVVIVVVFVVASIALRGGGKNAGANRSARAATSVPSALTSPTTNTTTSIVPAGVYRRIQNTGSDKCLRARDAPSLSATILLCAAEGFIVRIGGGPVTADGFDWYQADGVGWMAARDDSTGEVYFADVGTPAAPAEPFQSICVRLTTTTSGNYAAPSAISTSDVRFNGPQFTSTPGVLQGWEYGSELYLVFKNLSGASSSGTIVASVRGGSISGQFAATAFKSGSSGAVGTVSGSVATGPIPGCGG